MKEKIEVKVKHVGNVKNKAEISPYYATSGAAGADIYACIDEEISIKPGERVRIPTGIAIELPSSNVVALLFARSGLAAKQGLALSNGVGVIDSDYRGEIGVLITNFGQEDVIIKNGERIAQMLFVEVALASFVLVNELGDTERGSGGFGSTGLS
ncbi:MAG: deoxyuridine 5'-triphosphate nucleotidohydrolase [Gracilibacter sp. BRH_c7a]|nr:MAG: deoxyuridine 5'-triphosphate nucleotidohydrolase [Gracilibacter sp. BRH_c7a]